MQQRDAGKAEVAALHQNIGKLITENQQLAAQISQHQAQEVVLGQQRAAADSLAQERQLLYTQEVSKNQDLEWALGQVRDEHAADQGDIQSACHDALY